MSKERELLRKLFESGMLDRLSAIEVGQLLAQPEQTEQEPSTDDYAKLKEDYKHYISQKSQKREPLSDVNILCLNLVFVAIVLWFC